MLCDPVTAWVLARLAEANAYAAAEGWGYPGDEVANELRGGPVASHEIHTLVFAGSIPAPASASAVRKALIWLIVASVVAL